MSDQLLCVLFIFFCLKLGADGLNWLQSILAGVSISIVKSSGHTSDNTQTQNALEETQFWTTMWILAKTSWRESVFLFWDLLGFIIWDHEHLYKISWQSIQ